MDTFEDWIELEAGNREGIMVLACAFLPWREAKEISDLKRHLWNSMVKHINQEPAVNKVLLRPNA